MIDFFLENRCELALQEVLEGLAFGGHSDLFKEVMKHISAARKPRANVDAANNNTIESGLALTRLSSFVNSIFTSNPAKGIRPPIRMEEVCAHALRGGNIEVFRFLIDTQEITFMGRDFSALGHTQHVNLPSLLWSVARNENVASAIRFCIEEGYTKPGLLSPHLDRLPMEAVRVMVELDPQFISSLSDERVRKIIISARVTNRPDVAAFFLEQRPHLRTEFPEQ